MILSRLGGVGSSAAARLATGAAERKRLREKVGPGLSVKTTRASLAPRARHVDMLLHQPSDVTYHPFLAKVDFLCRLNSRS